MLSIVYLIGGLVLVVLGANWLVDGASSLAKRLNVSDLIIGLTIVAFGTSMPELTVSLFSALEGEGDIALGNIVGSNILNVLVILGVASLIYPLNVHSNTVWKEIPLSLLAALILLVVANDVFLDGGQTSIITRSEGLVLLGFFAIFLYYTFNVAKNQPADELHNVVKIIPLYKAILMVLGGLVLLVLGGKLFVDGAVSVAEWLGMSRSVIGLTIVALGTSVPELATSAVAAYKRNADIAVGNVVGSNIFNIFFILGTTATVHPLGLGNITIVDLIVCALTSLVLFARVTDYRLSRVEGGFLLVLYVAYVVYLLNSPAAAG